MRPYCETDTECHPNFWLWKFYLPMGPMRGFMLHDGKQQFTHQEFADIQQIVSQFTLVSYNGANYDDPMWRLAMAGADTLLLKKANDAIIVGGLKRWQFNDAFPMALREFPGMDHIDIMEVAPGVRIGLKTYMARMHSPTIQDLPYPPDALLTVPQMLETDAYCGNDLRGTRQLREIVQPRIALREKLTERYGVDMRSKSDAQMSESLIAARLGYRPRVPFIVSGHSFKLTPAPWLQFVSPQLRDVFELCKRVDFVWSNNDDGEEYLDAEGAKIKTGVNMPPELKKLKITIGTSTYKFGIGGIHSTESAQSYYSIPGVQTLCDHDVQSYYPSLAILMGLLPAEFRQIYIDVYNERQENKRLTGELKTALKHFAGNPALLAQLEEATTIADGLKIVLNGAYGKLWSKYSFLCAPEAGIAITLNGQLSFLMLIERLEMGGIKVISANTDGIVLCIPAGLEAYRDSTIAWFEGVTGLLTEATEYTSVHSRDVNSYVAVMPDGKVKRKGVFSKSGVLASMQGVHPDRDISKEAAVAYMTNRTPIADTVRACSDLRMFILAKSVKGGGQWRGQHLGKTVRWYYSTTGEPIRYISNGNKVAGSDGAQPVQTLPGALPVDIDYAQYEAFAVKLLEVAGVKYV